MKHTTSLLAIGVLTALSGCEVGNRPGTGDGGRTGLDGNVVRPDGSVPTFDPFDPANACGLSTIPTTQVPGSLLIVFDRSGSMEGEKWNRATQGINNVLSAVSNDLSVGLMLFPTSGSCDVSASPVVPVAPLSTSRSQIASALASASPDGGGTPAFAGLLAGYDHLDTLTTPGQRGIVLVSDGGETCQLDRQNEIFTRVQTEHDTKNRLTFAVGLQHSDNILSTIAYNGGTPRNDTCIPQCTSALCTTDADCANGAPCQGAGNIMGIATTGQCGCENDSHCRSVETCEPPDPFFNAFCSTFMGFPIPIPMPPECYPSCQGATDCCHYDASSSNFQTEFEGALSEIARRLLDSCVFDVPRGSNPDAFHPGLVNVGVTFDGEERIVLRQGNNTSVDSWNYTNSDARSLVIQGPICQRLLDESATVEIVLGCQTIPF